MEYIFLLLAVLAYALMLVAGLCYDGWKEKYPKIIK